MSTRDEQGYNGWTNYETWCVNLWLDNEELFQEDMGWIANQTQKEVHIRADMLKEYVNELGETAGTEPLIGASMFVDLLRSALDNVDWREIIRAHQED